MPAVFVHGVPDTHRVWTAVIDRLERDDVVALSLPGFGTARPPGWTATKEDYVGWVIDQLEQLGGPIDLVGHDWGSLLTIRVASVRGDLLRTWAAGNGPVDEEYTWHETAQLWQTPGAGEQVMEAMTPETVVPGLTDAGLPAADAQVAAQHLDDDMKSCILDLYRSATDVGAEWGPAVDDITTPGAVLWAQHDPYVPARFGRRLAERTGATLTELDCGHWWPCERPDEVATALHERWSTT